MALPPNPRLDDLSVALEAALVARNPRGMQTVRAALEPGYLLRAARLLQASGPRVLLCTGFPVADTFETDGPAGAIALYRYLEGRAAQPWMLAGAPLLTALGSAYNHYALCAFSMEEAAAEASSFYAGYHPDLLIVIERPGAAADGRYYNIAGRDISTEVRPFEPWLTLAPCPVIAIGDGGNEVGMGKAGAVLNQLNIRPATCSCDELIVADVSNWGAYALLAMVQTLAATPPLENLDPEQLLGELSRAGSVDGVTHANTLTEDGLPVTECLDVLTSMKTLCADYLTHTTTESPA